MYVDMVAELNAYVKRLGPEWTLKAKWTTNPWCRALVVHIKTGQKLRLTWLPKEQLWKRR